jgi:dTDP-4-amino-4,6-dideoxygalactose transaminase
LSFGNGKPLHLGRCGAILLDDQEQYNKLSRMRSNGRDLRQSPWQDYPATEGYHYCPTLETCKQGLQKLPTVEHKPIRVWYPDCREIKFQ